MTAFTDSVGFNKNTAAFTAPSGFNPISKLETVLDFAKIVAARVAAGATALAANDSLEVLRIPAGASILRAGVEVVSPETANVTGTVDLGLTGGDVDAWCDGLAINSAAGTISTNGVENVPGTGTAAANFAANDTLDLLFLTATPTNAVLRVFAVVVNRL
jgi:hypothetical protein